MKHISIILGAYILFASNLTLANKGADYHPEKKSHREPSNFEFIAMGGIATLDGEDISIVISEFETDNYIQTNEGSWSSGTGQVGIGYNQPLIRRKSRDSFSWLPYMTPQLNYYYLGGDLDGEVYAYQSPDWNIASYTMGLSSSRLMLDLALTFAAWKDIFWYGIGGLGVAWNEIDYKESIHAAYVDILNPISNKSQNSVGFAYEVGTGLTYAPTKRYSFSFQYLYSVLNSVEVGEVTGYHAEKSSMDIASQTLMLGLRIAI